MSTYSASKTVALAQSAEEGAALSGRPLSLAFSFPAGGTGVFASLAWAGFGISCLWWPDIGDWTRTHQLAAAAFVIAGAIFLATRGGQPARAVQCRPATACAMAAGDRRCS